MVETSRVAETVALGERERPLRILISAYGCDPESGSEARNGWFIASALAKRGHDVWVVTHEKGRQAVEAALEREPVSGLTIRFVGDHRLFQVLPKSSWMIRYMLWQRSMFAEAKKLAAELDFDVVHHLTWGSYQAGSPLWKLGRPFVFGPVGGGQVAPPAFKNYFGASWKRERIRSMMTNHMVDWLPWTRATVRKANMVIAANPETEALARRMGASSVQSICDIALPDDFLDLPAPASEPPISLDQGETKVVWLGRRLPRKALPMAFDVMARVDPKLPIHLYVIDGQDDTPLMDPGLDRRVTHLGRLAWNDVRNVLSQGHILLFTSLRDSTGAQLFEALGASMPVVTLDHHGARVLIHDRVGIRVPVTTPDETVAGLAEAIEKLHRRPALRERMGEAGVAEVAQQTVSARSVSFERVYRAVIAGNVNDRDDMSVNSPPVVIDLTDRISERQRHQQISR